MAIETNGLVTQIKVKNNRNKLESPARFKFPLLLCFLGEATCRLDP